MGQDADHPGLLLPLCSVLGRICLWVLPRGQGKAREEDSGSEACCLPALVPCSWAGVCMRVCVRFSLALIRCLSDVFC